MGHALNNTLQDVLVRWRRMKGDNALWIPGTDHGGIATQNVVEKILKKEGKTGTTFPGKFLERMWAWRKESGDTILHQLRKLGCSLDWTRTRFTMDEASSRAVAAAFVEFFSRGSFTRAFGWSTGAPDAVPPCRTSKWNTKTDRIPVAHSLSFCGRQGGGVIVATTRPETMLGDTGVAVNPTDERYQGLAGKKLIRSLSWTGPFPSWPTRPWTPLLAPAR
jgi:valyl-tRNA synthetase